MLLLGVALLSTAHGMNSDGTKSVGRENDASNIDLSAPQPPAPPAKKKQVWDWRCKTDLSVTILKLVIKDIKVVAKKNKKKSKKNPATKPELTGSPR